MTLRLKFALLAVSFHCLVGCGSATAPAEGGTTGILKFGTDVTSDIVVKVHHQNGGQFSAIGFGTTIQDGSFILYKPGATEPLWLEPGEYVFTLESIGPPVQFPEEYLEPKSTPLKITWTADMKSVDIEAPQKLIAP